VRPSRGASLRVVAYSAPASVTCARQGDARGGAVDRKSPAVAGDVPVQLVVALEEAELARGAVVDLVGVATGRQHRLGAADAHAHAVGELFGGPGFGGAVAQHGGDFERHAHAVAGAVAVGGRKVAQDAALSRPAGGLDFDGLGHRERAVGLDADSL